MWRSMSTRVVSRTQADKEHHMENGTFETVREVHFDAVADTLTITHWVRRKDEGDIDGSE